MAAQIKPLDIELLRKAVVWSAPGIDVSVIDGRKPQKVAFINFDVYHDEKAGITRLVRVESDVRREWLVWWNTLGQLKAKIEKREAEIIECSKRFECDAAIERMGEIEKMKLEFQRQANVANALFKGILDRSTAPIFAAMGGALNIFATQNELSLIFDVAKLPKAIIFVHPDAEITNAFCTGFNMGKYPPLNVLIHRLFLVNTGTFYDASNGIPEFVRAINDVDREFQPKRNVLEILDTDIQIRTRELTKTTGPMADSFYQSQRTNQLVELKQEYRRRSGEFQSEYKKRRALVEDPVMARIMQSLAIFAKGRGVSVVLDADVVGGAGIESDVTQTFITEFNRLDLPSATAK